MLGAERETAAGGQWPNSVQCRMTDDYGAETAALAAADAIAWRPTAAYLERSRLRRFMEREGTRDYEAWLARAAARPAAAPSATIATTYCEGSKMLRRVPDGGS